MGDPGFQVGVGEDNGAHQSTVSRTIDFVSRKNVAKANHWLKLPTIGEEVEEAKGRWLETYNLPCAFGAIDCTHTKIRKPDAHVVNDENNFDNVVIEDDGGYEENEQNENQIRIREVQQRNNLARILFVYNDI
ncbi:hypothetical protein FQR65_LT15031 [Abscondita terminalis]|nr:hypothetical protein FQR65_LT15031 [Abscondita terminalis]